MTDMMLVAFKADITRISTIMIGREGSTRAYPEIESPTATIRSPTIWAT